MRPIMIMLCLSLSGCGAYHGGREIAANADAAEERAAIIKMYRHCLEKYQDDPAKAKANCEHYTQSLQAIDVRGMK